jgi:hypothetical protein
LPQNKPKDAGYAYLAIHDFFDCYHLHSAAKELDNIIDAACSPHAWKVKAPAEKLFFIQQLGKLCKAALFIAGLQDKKHGAILGKTPKEIATISHLNTTINYGIPVEVWQCFPRHLTAGQYYNPYKALKKFAAYFTRKQWHKNLKSLFLYAFNNETMDSEGAYRAAEILLIRKGLFQLLEACYLIEVRTHKNEK